MNLLIQLFYQNSYSSDIACSDQSNQINPAVKFDTFVSYYCPKYATINMNPLAEIGDVDIETYKKVYSLDLEYAFDQKLAGTKNVIKFSLYDDLLYESLYEGNFWMLFDANKQLISSGEAFEESSKIPKQKGYVLKMQLRSSSIKLLEKAKNATLRIDTVFKKEIVCDVYSSKLGMLKGSGKVTSAFSLKKYTNKDFYISTPSIKDLGLKDIEAGSQLVGYLKLNKDSKESLRPKFRNNGQRGNASLCIPIVCAVSKTAKAAESKDKLPDIKDDEKKKDEDEDALSMEEKQRDAMIDWIGKKIKDQTEQKKAFESFGEELLKKYGDHLPLLLLKLDIFAKDKDVSPKEVISIADEILSKVNLDEIAAFFGKKAADKQDKEYVKNNKKYKEQKAAVIDALKAKLNAVKAQLIGADNKKKVDLISDFVEVSKDDLKEFEKVYKALGEWIDVEKDKKCFDLVIFYNLQKGLVSKVLTMINDKISANAKDDKAVSRDQVEMKVKLYKKYLPQFSFLTEQIELDLFKKFPKQYRAF